ncbi:MAG: TrkA C-terminal domain-containing protein, partial [Myxococcota bacterium]
AVSLAGTIIREAPFPPTVLVALIQRANGTILVPTAGTMIHEDDRLTFIGEPDSLADLHDMYHHQPQTT